MRKRTQDRLRKTVRNSAFRNRSGEFLATSKLRAGLIDQVRNGNGFPVEMVAKIGADSETTFCLASFKAFDMFQALSIGTSPIVTVDLRTSSLRPRSLAEVVMDRSGHLS